MIRFMSRSMSGPIPIPQRLWVDAVSRTRKDGEFWIEVAISWLKRLGVERTRYQCQGKLWYLKDDALDLSADDYKKLLEIPPMQELDAQHPHVADDVHVEDLLDENPPGAQDVPPLGAQDVTVTTVPMGPEHQFNGNVIHPT